MDNYPDLPRWIEMNATSDSGMALVIAIAALVVGLLVIARFKYPAYLGRLRGLALALWLVATLVSVLKGA